MNIYNRPLRALQPRLWLSAAVAVGFLLFGARHHSLRADVTFPPNAVRDYGAALVEGDRDFDGDGRTGAAEDADGDDIFGTINGVPGFSTAGPTDPPIRYSHITIVSSGIFVERLRDTFIANGSAAQESIIEAAPGVSAILQPLPRSAAQPQTLEPVCLTTAKRFVLRNLTFRQWSDAIVVQAGGRVLIENCRFEEGSRGVDVKAGGSAVILNCTFAHNTPGSRPGVPPNLVGAVVFESGSEGLVGETVIEGNSGPGLVRLSRKVMLRSVTVIGNNPNYLP